MYCTPSSYGALEIKLNVTESYFKEDINNKHAHSI